MYNILQEGVARKKETKPPNREEKINYFRNFRTTELIFLTGLKGKPTETGDHSQRKRISI